MQTFSSTKLLTKKNVASVFIMVNIIPSFSGLLIYFIKLNSHNKWGKENAFSLLLVALLAECSMH